jgi:hypothetical protein
MPTGRRVWIEQRDAAYLKQVQVVFSGLRSSSVSLKSRPTDICFLISLAFSDSTATSFVLSPRAGFNKRRD